MEQDARDRGSDPGRVLLGLIILGFGLALLIGRLGYSYFTVDHRYWPFLVAAFGVVRFLYPADGGSRRSGAWLIYIGFYGYVSEFHVWGLDYGSSWPLMIIGVGLGTIWRAFEAPRHSRPARS